MTPFKKALRVSGFVMLVGFIVLSLSDDNVNNIVANEFYGGLLGKAVAYSVWSFILSYIFFKFIAKND